jgi:hypothetical protein
MAAALDEFKEKVRTPLAEAPVPPFGIAPRRQSLPPDLCAWFPALPTSIHQSQSYK